LTFSSVPQLKKVDSVSETDHRKKQVKLVTEIIAAPTQTVRIDFGKSK
jgi:hypothetical protein